MNKQELIKKVKDIKFGAGDHGDTKNEHESEYALIDYILNLIEQLDEPQNESYLHDIKSQIEYLLDHGPGKNKSLRMLENIVDNMLQGNWALARVREEKVKVPLCVGNWIEYSKDEGWDFLRSIEEMTGPMGDGSVRRWFKNNSNKYADAWSNDFEVEEESKWKIINDQKYCLTSIEAGYGNSLHWAFDSTKKKPILFDNEETALYTAYITGGTVEKV
ncbi:DUF1642 domain-containing protein [Enterococcus raffinosus]|uniref:DUF1642 domain-containing protein n=1 Tax=Enterococcus raffinosus TaxID=71452 RepID=UPI00288D43A6|nr:DUF1642 domain-containing protein [Enterococcus raffinosus]MDT2531900.1 DUF1642 domain-containing protein [Enterococcus raffinosus]